jgi:hypothetical protein
MNSILFLSTAVRIALKRMQMPDSNAERLLMGTAVHESQGFKYSRQLGGGPALGYFQMEPRTHDDCWQNYIKYRPILRLGIVACLAPQSMPRGAACPSASLMLTNHVYAAAMARVRYMRAPGRLPHYGAAIAAYWKDNYNTRLGAGSIQEFKNSLNSYLAGILYERI